MSQNSLSIPVIVQTRFMHILVAMLGLSDQQFPCSSSFLGHYRRPFISDEYYRSLDLASLVLQLLPPFL